MPQCPSGPIAAPEAYARYRRPLVYPLVPLLLVFVSASVSAVDTVFWTHLSSADGELPVPPAAGSRA